MIKLSKLIIIFSLFSGLTTQAQTKLIDSLSYFVGKKIEIESLTSRDNWLNCFFKGKYEVVEVLKGDFKTGDTVEVIIFDHEDCPPIFTEFPHAFIGFRLQDNGENWILRGENCTQVFKSTDDNWVTGAFGYPKRIKHLEEPYPIQLAGAFYYNIKQLSRFNLNALKHPDDSDAIYSARNYSIDFVNDKVKLLRGYTVIDRYKILIRNFE